MPPFGPFNFEITSNSAKPKIGTLEIDYTLNADSSITGASFTYRDTGPDQTYPLTFTGPSSSGEYSGVPTTEPLSPPWNIPNQGNFKFATFSLNLTTNILT